MTTHQVPFGRPASEALAAVVAQAQAADPLDPVTIIVPSNVVGIALRRQLSAGVLTNGPPRGVANLTVTTPHQLAAHLGAPAAADGRVPLSNPVLAAAARRALATRPGRLAAVASHHATEQALVRVYGELSHLSAGAIDRLGASGTGLSGDLLSLVAHVREQLGPSFFDEDDVARAAARVVRSGDGPDLGAVVVHLIDRLSPAHDDLIAALAEVHDVDMIVGRTGVAEADSAIRPPSIVTDPVAAVAPRPLATGIFSVADSDEEVRAVVRLIAERVDAGMPLDDIAVLHPAEQPYARTLHEQLDAAGVSWNGPSAARLADTVAGRTLRRLLDLEGHGYTRDAVIDLVSGAPVRDDEGRLVPAARWDRLTRQAGVIAGREDWQTKLAAHAEQLRADRDEAEADDNQGRVDHLERERVAVETLQRFVAWLFDLAAPLDSAGWAERATWARAGLDALLGPDTRRTSWPEHELGWADAVAAALERVSVLDAIDPEPSADVFSRAVAEELDASTGRRGRVGTGVLVAPLAAAAGLDVEIVIVVGLAEGTCPAPRHEDSLLADRDRALTDGELELRADRMHLDHARLLGALGSGRSERVLVHPRGDHRNGRTRLPSRWLLDEVSDLVGTRLRGAGYDNVVHPAVHRIESFVDGLGGATAAASPHDLDLRTLAAAGGPSSSGPLADEHDLAVGLELQSARASSAFTRFDGNLSGVELPSPVGGGPLSATRIEHWASCPFRYFLGYVLRLGDVDRPERIHEIGALDRGSLVHEVYERFGRETTERSAVAPPEGEVAWSEAHHERLLEIAVEVCDEYEARGLTGRALLWRLQREDLLADFAAFLQKDDALRAATGGRWEAVEVAFGMDGVEPVTITLDDGRRADFRGAIDRVDRTIDGEAIVVDYKTGKFRSNSPYAELQDDPVVRGTKVQLSLYAEAVRQHHGALHPLTAYWFATSDGGFATAGYQYTPEHAKRFRQVVNQVVDNVERGVFPARSGPFDQFWGRHDNCGLCDFDRVCPRDRHERWTVKAQAVELSDYRSLAEPDEPSDSQGEAP